MVYEETSGLYYDYNSGYYYDAERRLYYDGSTGTWYKYNYSSGEYEIHSAGGDGKGGKAAKKRKRRDTKDLEEDGEVEDRTSEESDADVDELPPCMRLGCTSTLFFSILVLISCLPPSHFGSYKTKQKYAEYFSFLVEKASEKSMNLGTGCDRFRIECQNRVPLHNHVHGRHDRPRRGRVRPSRRPPGRHWLQQVPRQSRLHRRKVPPFRVVQPNFTPEIEVFYMLFERYLSIFSMTSLKQHVGYFHFRYKIQLDLPVQTLAVGTAPSSTRKGCRRARWKARSRWRSDTRASCK